MLLLAFCHNIAFFAAKRIFSAYGDSLRRENAGKIHFMKFFQSAYESGIP